MAVTSPDNIWTPDAGDDYALTTDLASTADTVQDAINSLRLNAPAQAGTNAQRLALTGTALFEGLRFYTTDIKKEWEYVGGAWSVVGALFVARRGTTQSLPSGWNVLSAYGTPVINEVGTWSAGGLAVTRAGIYRISLSAGLTNATTPGGLQITNNSTAPDGTTSLGTVLQNSSTNAMSLDIVVPLAASDTIRGLVYTLASNTVDTTGTRGLNLAVELLRLT